jgi:hypothetical protein
MKEIRKQLLSESSKLSNQLYYSGNKIVNERS